MPSKEKLYQELHFVQVQENSGGKFIYFIKLLLISHQTIFIIIFYNHISYQTRSGDKYLDMSANFKYFANPLFPYRVKEWNN